MRFGVFIAAAAALFCAGQTSAARFYVFEVHGVTRTTPLHYDVLMNFVFDTMPNGQPVPSTMNYSATDGDDTVFMSNVNAGNGVGYISDLPTPAGVTLNLTFQFADIAIGDTLAALKLISSNFRYDVLADPRYSTTYSYPGYVESVYARTSDVAPTFSGLVTTVTTVPEPASWALMILGFGIAGGALRNRQRGRRAASGCPC